MTNNILGLTSKVITINWGKPESIWSWIPWFNHLQQEITVFELYRRWLDGQQQMVWRWSTFRHLLRWFHQGNAKRHLWQTHSQDHPKHPRMASPPFRAHCADLVTLQTNFCWSEQTLSWSLPFLICAQSLMSVLFGLPASHKFTFKLTELWSMFFQSPFPFLRTNRTRIF